MPKFDSKNLQLVKDVTQVLYQMAVAVKVAVIIGGSYGICF